MTSWSRVGAVGPPPIPAARSDSTSAPTRPLLLWVRTGTAHVRIDGTAAFRLTAGSGIWIPESGWTHRQILTEPGTVAFPLMHEAGVKAGEGLSEPTLFDVPQGWRDWLIQYFNLHITPLSGRGYSHATLTELLRRPGARVSLSDGNGNPLLSASAASLPMPKARAAGTVAEALIRDPALDLTVQEWASRVLASPRTLRRDFLADTGLTFERWRLRCRLIAAVNLLAAGYDPDQVAARVGFASRNGFTRAFKQHVGLTPYEFGRRPAVRQVESQGGGAPGRRNLLGPLAAARSADGLVRMMQSSGAPTAPDMLPAASTPPHANGNHVLSWMYRGSGYLDIGGHRYERQRGVATWIPADVEHITGLRKNSISLPLGTVSTTDLQLSGPLQAQFPAAWEDFLMFCSICDRSMLRPDDYNPTHILDLFTEQLAAQRALSVRMPTDAGARAVAMNYLRDIGTPGSSARTDLPAEVHHAFRVQTGMSFARWRYAARMRIARDLLIAGAKPSAVARRVGYRHLSTFSAAFTRFHGMSPREFREREADA